MPMKSCAHRSRVRTGITFEPVHVTDEMIEPVLYVAFWGGKEVGSRAWNVLRISALDTPVRAGLT
jgi:hypothetical protein